MAYRLRCRLTVLLELARAGWAQPADETDLIGTALALALINRPPPRQHVTLVVVAPVDTGAGDEIPVDASGDSAHQSTATTLGVVEVVTDSVSVLPIVREDDTAAGHPWLFAHWLAALVLVTHWWTARVWPQHGSASDETGRSSPETPATVRRRRDPGFVFVSLSTDALPSSTPDPGAEGALVRDNNYCAMNHELGDAYPVDDCPEATLIGARGD